MQNPLKKTLLRHRTTRMRVLLCLCLYFLIFYSIRVILGRQDNAWDEKSTYGCRFQLSSSVYVLNHFLVLSTLSSLYAT